MKKKLLIGAVAALFLGAGVFTATSLTQKEQISDLTLANIEAMTFNLDDPEAKPINCHSALTGNSGQSISCGSCAMETGVPHRNDRPDKCTKRR